MDTAAKVQTLGNSDLPESTPDRPLVTFALVAYNQEQYIREAVEGAFSQTYEPLEIILSDDCSSDRTYEIMQEMAATYEGLHEVKVRRNEVNVGTLSHVLQVAHAANGTYLVVAAGDDISKPERTTITIKKMMDTGLGILSSASDEFYDDVGTITGHRAPVSVINDSLLEGRPLVHQIHGAVAAYCINFLKAIPIPIEKILLEDYAFRVIAFWLSIKVGAVKDSLIFHRVNDFNIGPKQRDPANQSIEDREKFLCAHFQRIGDTLDYLCSVQKDIISMGENNVLISHPINNLTCEYFSLRSNWMNNSLRESIRLFIVSRNFDSPRRDALRSLGTHVYFAISRLV